MSFLSLQEKSKSGLTNASFHNTRSIDQGRGDEEDEGGEDDDEEWSPKGRGNKPTGAGSSTVKPIKGTK